MTEQELQEYGLLLTDEDREELRKLEMDGFGEDYIEDAEIDFMLDNNLLF